MNLELLQQQLSELPLYIYDFFDPRTLEFSSRIRWICEMNAPCTEKAGHVLPVWEPWTAAGRSAWPMTTAC